MLTGMVGSDTTLIVDLGPGAVVPASTAALAAVGIVFYQEINGEFYPMNNGVFNALSVLELLQGDDEVDYEGTGNGLLFYYLKRAKQMLSVF